MNIGFDISQTGNRKAGCGFFADSMIETLTRLDKENHYILYPHFGTTFWDPEAEQQTRRIELPNVSRKRIGRDYSTAMTFWSDLPTDAEQRLGNPDIIHSNNYSCPKKLKNAKLVYTLYDLNFLEYPELTTEENRYNCFRGVFDAASYADFIVSISQYSRNKFLEIFPHYPRWRIEVVYLGSRFGRESLNADDMIGFDGLEPGRFWLSVGTLEPRKNLRRLLKAFANYLHVGAGIYPMALAGGEGWLEEDLQNYIESLGISGNVTMLGYVSDNQLSWLYRNCFCFLYPSLYEGFGLPVLEAMCHGAAVITSKLTSLPEVGGEAVYYVDPFNVNDITEALVRLESDGAYRDRVMNAALVQAETFSWDKSARQMLDIYKRVMELPNMSNIEKK